MLQMIIGGKLSIISEGHKVNVGILFPAKVAKDIRQLGELINIVQNELKVD